MSKTSAQLTNPFSSGGGGSHFEAQVQASFVVLMLTKGFVPCMPNWPIEKIKLQGKHVGYETDDLIVFVKNLSTSEERKILGQIKHSIRITENDRTFGEVIEAAWADFNNTRLFSKGKDTITLITGPLIAADISDTRTILEWARFSESAYDFFRKVEQANFSSEGKRNKLRAFKTRLGNANDNQPVPKETLFEFLKHFYLLGYDLDTKVGVTLALLHSLIGQYAPERVSELWASIVNEVQSANKNAGTITRDSLPEDLRSAFERRPYEVMPEELSKSPIPPDKLDWNRHPCAHALAIANLLGSWNGQNEADLEIILRLAQKA